MTIITSLLLVVANFIVVLTIMLLFNKDFFAKFLYLNSINNYVIVFIVLLSSYYYSFIDIALIYVLFSFIFTQAVLKFFKEK